MRKWMYQILTILLLMSTGGCGNHIRENDAPVEELTLEEGVLKVGMYMHAFPMSSVTEDTAEPEGFEVELAQTLGTNLGLEIQLVDITRDNLLLSLDADMVDCIISAVPTAQEKDSGYYCTQPYADLDLVKQLLPRDIAGGEVGIYTSRENGQLMLRLDDAITILKNNGQLSTLSQKYFETDITPAQEETDS